MTNIILTEVNGRMIDKRVNPYTINLNIDIPVMDKETIEEFQEEIQKIQNKYIGQAQDSMLLHQIAYDMEKLLQNEKYNGITVKNNEFFTNELWSLKKLLDVYNTEYPDRFISKKEYTNIEINNMLFDLNLIGVIGGYDSPAVCADIPSHNNKIFNDEYISVEVPIINIIGGL